MSGHFQGFEVVIALTVGTATLVIVLLLWLWNQPIKANKRVQEVISGPEPRTDVNSSSR
jgi:hypothetical protein